MPSHLPLPPELTVYYKCGQGRYSHRSYVWERHVSGHVGYVIIGNPYIAPDAAGTKLVSLGKTSFNVLYTGTGDGFGKRLWAETVAVLLVVAASLDTAEGGMVVRFLQKFAGSKMMPEDVDKIAVMMGGDVKSLSRTPRSEA